MNLEKIYKEMAEEHRMSVSELKTELQESIDEAYKDIIEDRKAAKILQLPSEIKVPTVDDFIKSLASIDKHDNILPKKPM